MPLLPDEQARIDKISNCASGNLYTLYREIQWLCEFVKAQEQLIDKLKHQQAVSNKYISQLKDCD